MDGDRALPSPGRAPAAAAPVADSGDVPTDPRPRIRRRRPFVRAAAAVLGAAALLVTVPSGAPPARAAPDRPFDWPLAPRPTIAREFDRPEQNWLPGHRGVDLAGAPERAVLAAGVGIVAFAGDVAGRPVVSVDHPGGLRTTYEPVTARVTVGTRVGKGTVLGYLEAGHTGCGHAACLHWGVRRGREYLDPTRLVWVSPIRLLPVGTGGGRARP
ncbi:hypothetical protein Rrhod_2643 [Rhodococcus rhodnii LMG 5362]|uniref:M23ase beta-sheet core domain-containing protein n=1 Tax=Rhodococcus rhodnii LMG 5362 TaxID=1273125 RepID=R7WL33_9NOCA|nr:hypothetical protein Rrhod_2643 [Rhodococcus rhodnii LMG 5362]